jgi:germination protein M
MKPTVRLVVAIATLSLLLAACGTASGTLGPVPTLTPTASPSTGPSEPDLTPGPSAIPTPSTDPSSSPQVEPSASPTGTMVVRSYFYLDGVPFSAGLVPYLFEVPETKGVASAAMSALLAGSVVQRDGFAHISSAIPAGTKLLGLTIKNGVATVDLSTEFESGGSASARTRLAQVVYTLTQFSTVQSVLFQIEGTTVTVFGGEGVGLDEPQARADYLDLLPSLFVDRPAFAAALGNPGRVAGSGQGVFEATFRITLLDGAGRTILDQQAMAACWCESGAFDVTLQYDVPKAQWGTLRVWAGSAKDGSPVSVREYPVWLTPAG